MKKEAVNLKMSKELKTALQRYAKEHGMSLTGLLLISVAFQNPDLKDVILRER